MKRIGTMTEEERLQCLADADGDWQSSRSDDGTRDYSAWVDGKVMYVKLEPGQRLHPHQDNETRINYVLQTNDRAITYIEGEAFNLEQGGIYELDATKEHWAVNDGNDDRIHKVLM